MCGEWKAWRDGQAIAGPYEAVNNLVATADVAAWAAKENGRWSIYVGGERRAQGLADVGEIILSPNGRDAAWAADAGDGDQLFVGGQPVSPPLAHVSHLAFDATGTRVAAIGLAGKRGHNSFEEKRVFVMVNGQRLTPLYSGKVAYALTGDVLHFAGFDTWEDAVIVGQVAIPAVGATAARPAGLQRLFGAAAGPYAQPEGDDPLCSMTPSQR